MNEDFRALVKHGKGFAWVDEGKGGFPKVGYVATKPGAWLTFSLDTTSTSGPKWLNEKRVAVQMSYLKSYTHMGTACEAHNTSLMPERCG